MDGGYGSGQMPLAGAILCCTSIPPEERGNLANIGAQMGAIIKLDLTSDVTHLIVGNINSAKYKYVAKAREDVKVLLPEWLAALNAQWKGGDDNLDLAALEKAYRLPTFFGLKICVTGFDNPDQRKYMQDAAIDNGAEYHGDLTKAVTHLIAAAPAGKKYEHAVSWGMQIVSLEWFEQSIQRGMALDEKYFHPTIAPADRGNGAWDRRRSQSPASVLGKRARVSDQRPLSNPLQRKLRRSASSRMGSQSQFLWAEITAGGAKRKQSEQDDWVDEQPIETRRANDNNAGLNDHTAELAPDLQDDDGGEDPVARTLRLPAGDGIFEGRLVFTSGFAADKNKILVDHMSPNGANMIRDSSELLNIPSNDIKRAFLVTPHDEQVDLALLPPQAGSMIRATNWWVERCLHTKSLVDPTEHVLCRPFAHASIDGFAGLIVSLTGFTGIELLHVTKAVALTGAKYDEYLTPKTSVIVCSTRKPNPDKTIFATNNDIPAVHSAWLWTCLETGQSQPYDAYLLNDLRNVARKPRGNPLPFTEVAIEKRPSTGRGRVDRELPARLPNTKSRQKGGQLALTVSAASSADTTAAGTNPNIARDDAADGEDAFIPSVDGPGSQPLQEIPTGVNSPRQPSTNSNTSASSLASTNLRKPPAPQTADSAKRPTPDSVIPPATSLSAPIDPNPEHSNENNPSVPLVKDKELEKEHFGTLMSNLLAQRKNPPNPAQNQTDKRKQRRQALGRAPSGRSNPSSAGDPASLSRHSSASTSLAQLESRDDGRQSTEHARGQEGMYEEYEPSQELGWDAPGAQEAREEMIRAMGGVVQEGRRVVQEVGVVRDAGAGEVEGLAGGRSRRRKKV